MSKRRAALKFGAAGAVTALYALAAGQILKQNKSKDSAALKKPVKAQQVVITVAALTTLTWIAALA